MRIKNVIKDFNEAIKSIHNKLNNIDDYQIKNVDRCEQIFKLLAEKLGYRIVIEDCVKTNYYSGRKTIGERVVLLKIKDIEIKKTNKK